MSKEMKILVALEFIENPQEILKRAMSIAEKYQARIYTLHVIEEMPRQAFYYDAYRIWEEFRDKAVKETIEKMSSYIKKLESKFADIEPMIEVGETSEKILEVADQLDVDLIILGHHKKRGVLKHLMHGNVCEKVVGMSKRPVLTFNIEAE